MELEEFKKVLIEHKKNTGNCNISIDDLVSVLTVTINKIKIDRIKEENRKLKEIQKAWEK